MKRSISNIFVVLLVLVGLSGCMDSRMSDICHQEKGKAKVSVFFQPMKETTVMRADGASPYGQEVKNCILFCFGADGHVLNKWIYSPEDNASKFTPDDKWQNSLGIDLSQQSTLYFYAIANFPKNQGDLSFFKNEPTLGNLRGVTTKSQLEDRLMQVDYDRLLDEYYAGPLLMVGSKTIDVQHVTNGEDIDIEMKRMMSKLTFDISVDPNIPDAHSREFRPLKWSIINVPTQISAWPSDDNDVNFQNQAAYTDFRPAAFQSKTFVDVVNRKQYPVPNRFQCYLMENRLPAQQLITWQTFNTVMQPDPTSPKRITQQQYDSDPSYAFGMRAHRVKSADAEMNSNNPTHPIYVKNGDFDVAPEHCTAIVVTGIYIDKTYSKKDPNIVVKTRRARVKYTIPMGYVGDPSKGLAKVDDYNVIKNHHYIYHAYVQDVDRIRLEVQDNNDNHNHNESDANSEGAVYDTENNVTLDAHYGTFILTIKKSDVEKYKEKGLLNFDYRVSTPFDHRGKGDITWVRFMLMPKVNGSYSTTLPDDLEHTVYASGAIKAIGPGYSTWNNSDQTNAFYIDGLCAMLNAEIKEKVLNNQDSPIWDNQGCVRFAAVVKEFYYDDYPTDVHGHVLPNMPGSLIGSYNFEKQGWHLFVNQPNRLMELFYHDASGIKSADQESSYAEADFTLSQRSIKTLVKHTDELGNLAVGFETIDEQYEHEGGPHPEFDYTNGYFDVSKHLQGWPNPNPYAPLDTYQKNQSFGYRPTLALYNLVDQNQNDRIVQTVSWSKYRIAVKDHYRPHFRVAEEDGNVDNRFSSIIYGCLSRNSDLNGDGKIEMNEVRWYIPAYRQIMQMILADNSLPYPERLQYTQFSHDYPSYVMTTTGAKYHDLWAVDVSLAYSEVLMKLKRRGSLRCVRNLGRTPVASISGYEEGIQEPVQVIGFKNTKFKLVEMPYDTPASNTWAFYDTNKSTYPFLSNIKNFNESMRNVGMVIHLDNMDPIFLRHQYLSSGALRYNANDLTTAKTGDIFHTNSTLNLPYYKGFRVAVYPLSNGTTYNQMKNNEMYVWLHHQSTQGSVPANCTDYTEKNPDGSLEKGWRIPNVTELALMNSYIPWSKDDNRRGWPQWGWHGGARYRTFFGPTLSATRIPGSTESSFILYDSGQDGFIVVGRPEDLHNQISWVDPDPRVGKDYFVRCVKDWDPDYEKFGHKKGPLKEASVN